MDLSFLTSPYIHSAGPGFYQLLAPYMILHRPLPAAQKIPSLVLTVPGFSHRYPLPRRQSRSSGQPKPFNQHLFHQHDYFEIMFVLSGEVIRRVEKKIYRCGPGQCHILNCGIRHWDDFSENSEVVFLMLPEEFLRRLLEHDIQHTANGSCHSYFGTVCRLMEHSRQHPYFPAKEYAVYAPSGSAAAVELLDGILEEICQLFDQMIEETRNQKPGYLFLMEGLTARFFSMLENTGLYHASLVRLTSSKEELLVNKISHIFEACHGNIGREELALLMDYNSDYLNRVVKRQTGLSLMSYAQLFCLKEAERLLLESSKSIAEIVSDLGFSNRSYFYRVFEKKYGMTPKEYRKFHNIYF